MSAAVSRDLVHRGVSKGISNAYISYKAMAKKSLHEAPELFLAVRIAEELHRKTKSSRVTLESSVNDILKESGAIEKGRPPKALRRGGRFDVVLWYGMGKPRAVIEVKHPLSFNTASRIDSDVERICSAVSASKRTGGSLKFGIFAFFARSTEPKAKDPHAVARLKKRLKKIELHCKSLAKNHSCTAKMNPYRMHRDGVEAWAACIVSISAK